MHSLLRTRAARKRLSHWALRVAVALLLAAGLVLIWLLVVATNNQLLYEHYYTRLLLVNLLATGFLALVVVWGVWRLIRRLRRGTFGSRLLIKLAAIFALVGVLPGLFVYTVSYQFVSRSIESWFDAKVEGALESGLSLARTSLETQARDFGNQLHAASLRLVDTPDSVAALPLERIRAQLGAVEATLWSHSGKLIASTGEVRFQLMPARPPAQLLRGLRGQDVATQIEGLDEPIAAPDSAKPRGPRVQAVAVVGNSAIGMLGGERVIQAVQLLPSDLVQRARDVQEANREYQERALGQQGLRRMYIGTLTLSLILAVFGAVLLAVILGKQLATPLLMLAEGVREVAAGDLRPKDVFPGHDELGGLTRSFADMTRQLAEARAEINSGLRQVEAARANLQTILDNLTAGVIVLDGAGVIRSINPGATRILRAPLAAFVGRELQQVPRLEEFGRSVQREFGAFEAVQFEHGVDHWQQPYELYNDSAGANAQAVSIVARGARLPSDLHLLVFDDISELVSAQRTEAWGEVARRLAHEIKNPLTPIQLSAERMQRRLADKLEGADRALLIKAVGTIVDQVDAMKRLVNEFREYARLPAAKLQPLDLNELIAEVLHLYGVAAADGGDAAEIGVRMDTDPKCPPILGDAQQLRQVIHNLVQNALDASEGVDAESENAPPTDGERGVVVRTRWLDATHQVRFTVADHGRGFPTAILKRAFEPYVTTKPKGTGLGLAMVKKIAEEHHARIDLSNRTEGERVLGAQVSLTFAPAPTEGAGEAGRDGHEPFLPGF